ncbi:hypothetical protein GCM10027047_33230 [Rhodococcus aerolatus]
MADNNGFTPSEDPADTTTPETSESPAEDNSGGSNEPETFSADYVKELRDEAAANRVAAKRAATLETALRDAVISNVAKSILADPTDLAWSDDLADDDGMPDPDAIRQAATALAARKPHLGRVSGDAGQGFRGDDSGSVSLLELLKA